MKRDLKFATYLAVLAGLFLLWRGYQAHLRNDGALREQAKALEARNARLEDEAGRIDTVYRVDTVRLSHTRVRTDSILRTDTVFTRERVTQIVKDERESCSAVIQTCEAAKANLRAQLAVSDSLRRIAEKQRPGFIRRTFGCTAGIAATTSGAGLGASCGVRFP